MSYIYNMADTWNNSGTTFSAIKMNVTDTASAANSSLMDLQLAGTSLFKVTKAGRVGVGATTPAYELDVTGNINFTGSLYQNDVLFVSGGASFMDITKDIDTAASFIYYGGTNNGAWQINRYSRTNFAKTKANVGNNGGYANLDNAWTDRATLTYT